MSMMHCSLLSLGCAFGFAPPTDHNALTAFRALKIAQRRLRPEVRNKLLSVSSARTDQTLVPEAWRFVFFDPATSGNCRVVTVAAKTSSEHPDTVEAFSSSKVENVAASHAIPQNKLLVDSDKALEQVRVNSKLKGVRSAEYRLLQRKGSQEPSWTIQFHGEDGATVARFRVGAKTGAFDQNATEK
jgi:hypothetical protein